MNPESENIPRIRIGKPDEAEFPEKRFLISQATAVIIYTADKKRVDINNTQEIDQIWQDNIETLNEILKKKQMPRLFGERLIIYRNFLGVKIIDMERKLGIKRNIIYNIEADHIKITPEILERIVEALRIPENHAKELASKARFKK